MRAVITGGGTGGHLFPGIALANALKGRDPASEILFIGTARLMDQQALQDQDFQLASLESGGIKGLGFLKGLQALWSQPRAILQALKLLKKFRPEIVFGVGGYVTGPVLVAAKTLGIPTAIHEQNSVPGLANRLAARFVDKICISLPCEPAFPAEKTVLTGNPVRAEILAAAGKEREVRESEVLRILVLGGSQGAHVVNTLMVAALGILQKDGLKLRVHHQTGQTDAEMVRTAYKKAGVDAKVSPFIKDMAAAYTDADLAVSRAGATSLAELAVMGLSALLIPYPFAADNHQAINAQHYAEGGGAQVFQEKDLTAEILAQELKKLAQNPIRLQQMGAAMRQLALPDAAERLVEECQTLAQGR